MSATMIDLNAALIASLLKVDPSEARVMAAGFELLRVAREVLAHVEDENLPRREGQCTLCYTYRRRLRDVIEKAEGLPNAVSVSAGAGPEGGKEPQ